MEYIVPIARLIEQFQKFQGIGAKSAQRLVFQMLGWDQYEIQEFANILSSAAEEIGFCSTCFNFSERDKSCNICSNNRRDSSIVCIVPTVRDLIAIERTNRYQGVFHVLHGLISPMDGIGPDDLKIKELIHRISSGDVKEIILAISPSTEGEATSLYIVRLIKHLIPKITRLSFGLAVGADIDQTDELTLVKALEGRNIC